MKIGNFILFKMILFPDLEINLVSAREKAEIFYLEFVTKV